MTPVHRPGLFVLGLLTIALLWAVALPVLVPRYLAELPAALLVFTISLAIFYWIFPFRRGGS